MLRVVLDTNIIVSAMLTPKGIPAKILHSGLAREFILLVSMGVMCEYNDVLYRKKFENKIPREKADKMINLIQTIADYYVPITSTIPQFTDETDRKFYDLAKAANAYLITGNIKHFPQDNKIITPADFLKIS